MVISGLFIGKFGRDQQAKHGQAYAPMNYFQGVKKTKKLIKNFTNIIMESTNIWSYLPCAVTQDRHNHTITQCYIWHLHFVQILQVYKSTKDASRSLIVNQNWSEPFVFSPTNDAPIQGQTFLYLVCCNAEAAYTMNPSNLMQIDGV